MTRRSFFWWHASPKGEGKGGPRDGKRASSLEQADNTIRRRLPPTSQAHWSCFGVNTIALARSLVDGKDQSEFWCRYGLRQALLSSGQGQCRSGHTLAGKNFKPHSKAGCHQDASHSGIAPRELHRSSLLRCHWRDSSTTLLRKIFALPMFEYNQHRATRLTHGSSAMRATTSGSSDATQCHVLVSLILGSSTPFRWMTIISLDVARRNFVASVTRANKQRLKTTTRRVTNQADQLGLNLRRVQSLRHRLPEHQEQRLQLLQHQAWEEQQRLQRPRGLAGSGKHLRRHLRTPSKKLTIQQRPG